MPQDANQFTSIFISYRRDDSAGHAGRLYDRLTEHFGNEQIFKDMEYIEPGEDFVQVIEEAVGSCEVLLALIGRSWLKGAGGRKRRLDNPNDFVRLEIASALNRNIRVIPVLVQGASMPGPQDLPDDLAKLARRNAIELSEKRWQHDVDQLIGALEKARAKLRDARGDETRTESKRRPAPSVVSRTPARRKTKRAASAPPQTATKLSVSAPPQTVAKRAASAPPQTVANAIGMEFVWIPPGTFIMGSENKDLDERPVHQVTIVKGFYMGKYEVTQAQWQQVMGSNPSNFRGANLPVEKVSWDDAISFIARLNAQNDGFVYRLPTEAEWEYACRAGTTTKFAFGDSLGAKQANFDGRHPHGGAAKGVYRRETTPVGSFQPNSFGLYDMHGNVWEWCQDWYHGSYAGSPTDGSVWISGGEQKNRVLRGGSWSNLALNLRSAYRLRYAPDNRDYDIGFRVVAVART